MKNICLILIMLAFLPAGAQSDLLITPYRVVFENGKNMEEISLANTGKDTARYTVNFVQYRMSADGAMEQITTPDEGQMFADQHLRIFPRSVVLAPNESQIVRVQLKPGATLTSGEYRSHLYFRSTPNENVDATTAGADTSLGIKLIPVYGITIPVIIRSGDLQVNVTIDNAQMVTDSISRLKFTINRSGSKSVYGDITVMYQPVSGDPIKVGAARGVSVYTPNALRNFIVPLAPPAGVTFNQGSLKITYSTAGTPKPEIIAEYVLNL